MAIFSSALGPQKHEFERIVPHAIFTYYVKKGIGGDFHVLRES
jgi:hypothetical protein